MILENAKDLLRVGRVLHLMEKLGEISIRLRICCFSCMFREREGALIFTGEFQFEFFFFVEVFLLKEFTDLFVFLFSCSFLRKLYPGYLECPRSYDKLRFDPRWCRDFAHYVVTILLWLFWLFIRVNMVTISVSSPKLVQLWGYGFCCGCFLRILV